MKILQINKYYYLRGGADVVMLELSKLLEEHGHTVAPFAMAARENLPSPYAKFFVSEVQTEKIRMDWQGLRTTGRMLYSFEAKRKLTKLIETTGPEIAHIHNIYHQISPSIFSSLRANHIPVVMTVHDWALISPNYLLFDHGEICERGVKNPWSIIAHRCIKDSLLASTLAAFVFNIHKTLRLYERGIDRFIAPSEFVKGMLVRGGFPEDAIHTIPHFIRSATVEPSFDGSYVGFIGRLSSEKGIAVLLAAARELPEIPFKIAGVGPEERALRAWVEKERLRNIEFVGRLLGAARDEFYRGAKMVVVPSVWYEIFGMVVLEAYAAGKPVIASAIGGLPEVVRDGETGFLVPPGNAGALAERIRALFGDSNTVATMGRAARHVVETEYNPELHYERIVGVYRGVIDGKSGERSK